MTSGRPEELGNYISNGAAVRNSPRRDDEGTHWKPVILSTDFMILRLTTVHENGSLEVTPGR
ncbi:hypothetical protein SBA2_30152 [Acidobacteriia bacterium SbA2]|nr:hypothetical protein SBA2_30152 [Acidobacteriia bacterium SbA2]